ncbi:MAG: hypothetical protein Q9190_005681 [Brigantiaea leucoxantha]
MSNGLQSPNVSLKDSPRALIGTYPNHWLWSSSPAMFDLTRPPPPDYPRPSPKESIWIKTTTTPIIISPSKTALVIIDMQNFFLSTALGRPVDSAGNQAAQRLIDTTIPAARKAGIRIIWLNWGLTDKDLSVMPPSTRRAFGFEAALNSEGKGGRLPALDPHGVNQAATESFSKDRDYLMMEEITENGRPERIYTGLGSEMGPVKLEDGSTADGGRLLMRDAWNSQLPPALDAVFQEGLKLKSKPDVWIHKNRMTGL